MYLDSSARGNVYDTKAIAIIKLLFIDSEDLLKQYIKNLNPFPKENLYDPFNKVFKLTLHFFSYL